MRLELGADLVYKGLSERGYKVYGLGKKHARLNGIPIPWWTARILRKRIKPYPPDRVAQ